MMNTTAMVCHAGATDELVEETSGLGGVDNGSSLVNQSTRFSVSWLDVLSSRSRHLIPLPLLK